jgi:hypothetical protein
VVDFTWSKYAQLQAELRDNHSVGDRSWGIEAGLNRILAAPIGESPANDNDIQRAVSSRQRRERHRAALRRLYLVNNEAGPHPEAFLQARAELRSIRAKVISSDWHLLCAVGVGLEYAEIATVKGASTGALRVRVSRLRRKDLGD